MNVISNQPHHDCPADHQSPVLQFEAEELRSYRERSRNGFESKRHGSACESAKELQNRRQQQRAACASPLLPAGPLAGDVCYCPDDEESSTENPEALGIAECTRKERSNAVAAKLRKRWRAQQQHGESRSDGACEPTQVDPPF